MRAQSVSDGSHVAEARRNAVSVGAALGFDEVDRGRIAIVATELATNLLKHGRGGELLFGAFEDETGAGFECLSLDRGPGIADVGAALRDGHSTAGTAGNGLGAVARQAHLVDIYSRPDVGTAILARLQHGTPTEEALNARHPAAGAVSVAKPGEEACGDAWAVRRESTRLILMVVDGLGHGPLAATASHEAVKAFEKARDPAAADVFDRMHQSLRSTRGAAVSIAALPATGDVTFMGVGNVAGLLMSHADSRKMVSYNGTLGHALKTVRPFSYPAPSDALVILASDGLGTTWSLDAYPGLRSRHPTLIAGVLYRDFWRRRDDVTVLVGRRETL